MARTSKKTKKTKSLRLNHCVEIARKIKYGILSDKDPKAKICKQERCLQNCTSIIITIMYYIGNYRYVSNLYGIFYKNQLFKLYIYIQNVLLVQITSNNFNFVPIRIINDQNIFNYF